MNRPLLNSTIAFVALGLVAILPVSAAQAASCASFGRVKSKNSNTPVTVTFVNKSGAYRSVMWIDFNGQPKDYAGLNPGQKYTINTFLTHPWMFTDGPGNCKQMFIPRKGVSRFNITR